MNKTENEIWKTYPDYDFIQGSNFGRVRTLDRYVRNKNGKRIVKGRILKQYHTNCGYMDVQLTVNGKRVHILVHRIIAETFITNYDNLPEINHKDNDRTNNNITNLEWCTHEYNIEYREKYGISAEEALGCPVFAINLKTQEVFRFRSHGEATREIGVNRSHIYAFLTGKCKTAKGFWFTNADSNAVEATRAKFGDKVANKVLESLNKE